MADVPELKAAFANGEDIHARTAEEMFGHVDRDTRARAKTINFAILYGISRWGLGARLGVASDEAQAMIDRYFERFPGIQQYIHATLETVRERGYSETLFGRKTWFPRINSNNPTERSGKRTGSNQRPDPGHQRRYHQARHGRMGCRRLRMRAWAMCGCCCRSMTNWCSNCPKSDVAAATPVIERVMAEAAGPR